MKRSESEPPQDEENDLINKRRSNWARLIARAGLERPDIRPSCARESQPLTSPGFWVETSCTTIMITGSRSIRV